MKFIVCPRCGSNVDEDAWGNLQEKEDGGFVMDAFPIYICEHRCGYMKRVVPKVIAQQGHDRLLYYTLMNRDAYWICVIQLFGRQSTSNQF